MNVEFLMAARARIVYDGTSDLAAALLDKPDNDALVNVIEEAFSIYYGNKARQPLDALELMIAGKVDGGGKLPISNPEGFGAAQWIAQVGTSNLPSPIPRGFVLYLAKAMADEHQYPTMTAALKDILATKQFA
jgi:hypothetical protein